jgi:hypothetical protein
VPRVGTSPLNDTLEARYLRSFKEGRIAVMVNSIELVTEHGTQISIQTMSVCVLLLLIMLTVTHSWCSQWFPMVRNPYHPG